MPIPTKQRSLVISTRSSNPLRHESALSTLLKCSRINGIQIPLANTATFHSKGGQPERRCLKKFSLPSRQKSPFAFIGLVKNLGIGTVAVFSEAIEIAFMFFLADEAYCIGPAPSRESYLSIPKIIETAKKSGAEAIHPGYGFLSENEDFAEACQNAGELFLLAQALTPSAPWAINSLLAR